MQALTSFREVDQREHEWRHGDNQRRRRFPSAYTADGQRGLTKEWHARVQYGDKRQFFSLETPNKAAPLEKPEIFIWRQSRKRVGIDFGAA
jgi:hypothetical protein